MTRILAWLRRLLFGPPQPNIRISDNVPWDRATIKKMICIAIDLRLPFEEFRCHIKMGSPRHKGKLCAGWTDGYSIVLDKDRAPPRWPKLSDTAFAHEIEHVVRAQLNDPGWLRHDGDFDEWVVRANLKMQNAGL